MQGKDASTCEDASAPGNTEICGTREPRKSTCDSAGEVQKLDLWMGKAFVNINCVGAGACIHIHKVILAAMSYWVSLLPRLQQAAVAVTQWCRLIWTI